MDVVDWLRALDLGQYEETFRENRVSMDLLPSLTADDLKELGVNTVGDRRRLLNAISALRASTEQNSAGPIASILNDDRQHTAERRPLSVMFCDLIGSTALRRGSIPRICARSSAPTSMRPRHHPRLTASSRVTSATGC